MELPGPSRPQCRCAPVSEARRVRPRHFAAGLVESRLCRRDLAAAATISARVQAGQERNVRPRVPAYHGPSPLAVPALADPTTSVLVTTTPFSSRRYNAVRKCLSMWLPLRSYPSLALHTVFPFPLFHVL